MKEVITYYQDTEGHYYARKGSSVYFWEIDFSAMKPEGAFRMRYKLAREDVLHFSYFLKIGTMIPVSRTAVPKKTRDLFATAIKGYEKGKVPRLTETSAKH